MNIIQAQTLPTNWLQREQLRQKGQFWTPAWIAEAMITYLLQGTATEILDPATGEGAFLQALRGIGSRAVFHGFDIDEHVLALSVYQDSRSCIEKRDFVKSPPNRLFPAIVGNPPYIRHHRIDEKTKQFLKQLTTSIIGSTIDGRAGYHVYFFLQALRHLEQHGKLAFILPADTFEGVFAKKLWHWITQNFCLDAVITFAPEAAPFPNIDTNALIVCVRNEPPKPHCIWAKVLESGNALLDFITSGFERHDDTAIDVHTRIIQEAVTVGLSREPNNSAQSKYMLADFANVMRGVATGANEFFFLTKAQAESYNIPLHFFKRTIGRTRDISGDTLTLEDMQRLDEAGRPTYLLALEQGYDDFPYAVQQYLEKGIAEKLPERALIKLRNPWYKTERRAVPDMLFAYLGRRSVRFIINQANVIPLHCLHCVYAHSQDPQQKKALWQVCNHPDTLAGLVYVSKSYGDGALKAEPQNLKKLPIPEHLVTQFSLVPRTMQSTITETTLRLFQ